MYSHEQAGMLHCTRVLSFALTKTGMRAGVLIPGEVDTKVLDNRSVATAPGARQMMMDVDAYVKTLMTMITLPKRSTMTEMIIKPTSRHADPGRERSFPRGPWQRSNLYAPQCSVT